jgi:heme-degrading monooxygenase HmoA
MTIVRINAIEVPDGMGPMLEERFAQRLGSVDQQPGFEGFELLRPTGDNESRYFVVTHWRSVEDFDAWVSSAAFRHGHSGPPSSADGGHGGHGGAGAAEDGGAGAPPVASGSSVLEFEVVLSSQP